MGKDGKVERMVREGNMMCVNMLKYTVHNCQKTNEIMHKIYRYPFWLYMSMHTHICSHMCSIVEKLRTCHSHRRVSIHDNITANYSIAPWMGPRKREELWIEHCLYSKLVCNSATTGALVTFLLLFRDTMTKATFRRKTLSRAWLEFQSVRIHEHDAVDHDSRCGPGAVAESLYLAHKQETEREVTGNAWVLKSQNHPPWHSSSKVKAFKYMSLWKLSLSKPSHSGILVDWFKESHKTPKLMGFQVFHIKMILV